MSEGFDSTPPPAAAVDTSLSSIDERGIAASSSGPQLKSIVTLQWPPKKARKERLKGKREARRDGKGANAAAANEAGGGAVAAATVASEAAGPTADVEAPMAMAAIRLSPSDSVTGSHLSSPSPSTAADVSSDAVDLQLPTAPAPQMPASTSSPSPSDGGIRVEVDYESDSPDWRLVGLMDDVNHVIPTLGGRGGGHL